MRPGDMPESRDQRNQHKTERQSDGERVVSGADYGYVLGRCDGYGRTREDEDKSTDHLGNSGPQHVRSNIAPVQSSPGTR